MLCVMEKINEILKPLYHIFCILGLAVISLCISLIQEQIGRSAAIAMGVTHQVIEIDVVEIIPRRKNFLTSDETPEDFEGEGVTIDPMAAVTIPVTGEPNLPGEIDDKNEEDEEEDEEDEDGEEDEDEEEDEEDDDENEEEG